MDRVVNEQKQLISSHICCIIKQSGVCMIIGVCGLIGSGKGTVADILEGQQGFKKVSFADSLKDSVASVFGWPRHLLEGDTAESREWREQVDAWWSNRLDIPTLTPRWVLQYWGTDVCRHGFHPDIWLASLERKLSNSGNFIIPDTRFPNEVEMIQRLGGQVWRVTRGVDPAWLTAYITTGVEPEDVHASEYMWSTSKFDKVIPNDGTLKELRKTVKAMINE